MRPMACNTLLQWVMRVCDYLRKTGGSRGKVFVADQTGLSRTVYLRFMLLLVLRMRVRRTVARFAGNTAVVSCLLGQSNLAVTINTDLTTRVFKGQLRVLYDRRRPVVAPEPKPVRDEELSDNEINDDKGNRRNNDVPYLLRYTFPHINCPVQPLNLIQSK